MRLTNYDSKSTNIIKCLNYKDAFSAKRSKFSILLIHAIYMPCQWLMGLIIVAKVQFRIPFI